MPILVMGMGIDLYGKERRVIRMLSRMTRLSPLFMISRWDRGEVADELTKFNMLWRKASFGYLGFAHPWWTLKNIAFMPSLYIKVLLAQYQHRAQVFLFAEVLSFLNGLPVFVLCRFACRKKIVFYLGDIGGGSRTQRLLLRLADRCADGAIVNSQAVCDGLRARGFRRTPIQVVHNGVHLPQFRNVNPVDRRMLGNWSDDDVVVGFVGQLMDNKGPADFLEAARLVLKTLPNVRFLVVGGCPKRTDYPARLKHAFTDLGDNVHFLGFTSDIERYYKTIDLLVVPSRYADPAPNVVLEAMASSLPVIGTAIGGIPELIVDNVTGFLVAPCRPDEIAHRIEQLAQNRSLRHTMGQAGLRRCEEYFDREQNARTVEELILNTVSSSEQPSRSMTQG